MLPLEERKKKRKKKTKKQKHQKYNIKPLKPDTGQRISFMVSSEGVKFTHKQDGKEWYFKAL